MAALPRGKRAGRIAVALEQGALPARLYDTPAPRFLASLATQDNFLPGKIKEAMVSQWRGDSLAQTIRREGRMTR